MTDATTLLSRALDLCVRARGMDAIERREHALGASKDPDGWQASGQFDQFVAMHNRDNPDRPIGTRSLTLPLWMQDQYERDLAEWEREARAFLMGQKT